jgi:GT2 family glycosyltransferase
VLGVNSLGSFSDHTVERDVDCVLGACLLTRRWILKEMGGFDENIFVWCEEDELCYRISQAKWRVVYYPDAEVIHLGGSTQGKIGEDAPERVIVQKCKSNLYYEKHASSLHFILYRVGLTIFFALRWVLLTVQLCFSTAVDRCTKLAEREQSLAIVRILSGQDCCRRNVYTDLNFRHLE